MASGRSRRNTGSGDAAPSAPAVLVNAGGRGRNRCLASGAGVNARQKCGCAGPSHIVGENCMRTTAPYVPEQPTADRLRHSLSGRLHANRHHRRISTGSANVKASTEEIKYLCDSVSEYLAKTGLTRGRGLGPMPGSAADTTTAPAKPRRHPRHVFELGHPAGARCCRSTAGKITTYRRLPKSAGAAFALSAQAPSPRGLDREIRRCPAATWTFRRFQTAIPELVRKLSVPQRGACHRLAHAYGTRAENCSAVRNRWPISVSRRATLTESEVGTDVVGVGFAPPRTSYGGDQARIRLSPAEIAAIDDWIAPIVFS